MNESDTSAANALLHRRNGDSWVEFLYDDLDDVMEMMSEQKIRRLPVVDRNKRLVGIISLSDAALRHKSEIVGDALSSIAQPGGAHSQPPGPDGAA